MNPRRLFTFVVALLLCAAAGGACEINPYRSEMGGGDEERNSAYNSPDDFAREFAAKENVTLRVRNASGNVVVRGTDVNRITVRGIKEGRDRNKIEVVDKSTDDKVDVSVRYHCRSCNGGVRFEVEVPRGLRLKFDEVMTASGDVRVKDVTGTLGAETASGNVEIENVTGTVEAESASGNVIVRGVAGTVNARTASGNVDVSLKQITGNGDMSYETASGNVTVSLPSDANAEVEMRTMSGDVETDFPIEVDRPEHGSGARAEGRLGGGGRKIELSAASGNVKLKRS